MTCNQAVRPAAKQEFGVKLVSLDGWTGTMYGDVKIFRHVVCLVLLHTFERVHSKMWSKHFKQLPNLPTYFKRSLCGFMSGPTSSRLAPPGRLVVDCQA